jgi:hypothetical protein
LGRWHPSVSLGPATFDRLRSVLLHMALRLSARELDCELRAQRIAPFSPVKRQLWRIVREVNALRAVAGLDQLNPELLFIRRRTVWPFADSERGNGG